MADVAMGNLRFDLTADNSSFMAAIRQAKDAQTQAASEMGSKFAEASTKAEQAVARMAETLKAKSLEAMRNLIDLGKTMGSALAKGGEDAENAITEVFTKQFKGGFDKAWNTASSLISKGGAVGKLAAGVMTAMDAIGLKDMLRDKLSPSVAGGLDSVMEKLGSSNWGAAIASIFPADMAADVQARVDGWVEAIRTSLQRLAGTWTGVSEEVKKAATEMAARTKIVEAQTGLIGLDVGAKAAAVARETMLRSIGKAYGDLNDAEKDELATQEKAAAMAAIDQAARNRGVDAVKKYEDAIDSLRKKNSESTFQNNLLGSSAAQKAEATEFARILDQLGTTWDRLTEKQKLEAVEQSRIAGIRAQAAEDYRKAEQETKAYEQSVTSLTAALRRQGDMALANAGRGEGKSAFDRAMERSAAMADGYSRGKVGNLSEDPSIRAARAAEAQKAQDAANLSYRVDQSRMLREANDRGFLDQSTMGSTPGATEKMRVEMELMNKARREGVTLDQQQVALNQSIAESMGKIAQSTAEARERFQAFREVGQTVASSLEDAFGKFINGTRVGWKEFIGDLEKDLARLAFKRGIESILTGTAAGGGGLFGALAGMISGARATGGPVSAGGRYIVGERGPEMFVPQSAGSIVPNHALNGAGSGTSVINMRIDLKGANGDETIARISAQAARQAAMAAIQQSNDGFAARQRRLNLLGS